MAIKEAHAALFVELHHQSMGIQLVDNQLNFLLAGESKSLELTNEQWYLFADVSTLNEEQAFQLVQTNNTFIIHQYADGKKKKLESQRIIWYYNYLTGKYTCIDWKESINTLLIRLKLSKENKILIFKKPLN